MFAAIVYQIKIVLSIVVVVLSIAIVAAAISLKNKGQKLNEIYDDVLEKAKELKKTDQDLRKALYTKGFSVNPNLIINRPRINNNFPNSNRDFNQDLATAFDTVSAESNSYLKPIDSVAIKALMKFKPFGYVDLWFDSTISYQQRIEVWEGTHITSVPAGTFDYREPSLQRLALGMHFRPLVAKDGQFFININIYDYRNNLIASIINNKIFGNKKYHGYIDFDHKGIEVLDSMQNVAFSINFVDPNQIHFQGYFFDKDGYFTVIGTKSLLGNMPTPTSNDDVVRVAQRVQQKKLFDYSDLKTVGIRAR